LIKQEYNNSRDPVNVYNDLKHSAEGIEAAAGVIRNFAAAQKRNLRLSQDVIYNELERAFQQNGFVMQIGFIFKCCCWFKRKLG